MLRFLVDGRIQDDASCRRKRFVQNGGFFIQNDKEFDFAFVDANSDVLVPTRCATYRHTLRLLILTKRSATTAWGKVSLLATPMALLVCSRSSAPEVMGIASAVPKISFLPLRRPGRLSSRWDSRLVCSNRCRCSRVPLRWALRTKSWRWLVMENLITSNILSIFCTELDRNTRIIEKFIRPGGAEAEPPTLANFYEFFPKLSSCNCNFFIKFAGRPPGQNVIIQYFPYKWVRGAKPPSARGNLKFLQKNRMISIRF